MNSGSDPYQILGVSTSATMDEIKAAFKRLALQFHPDKANSPDQFKEFNDRFRLIQAAYKALISPDSKQEANAVSMLTSNPLEIEYLRKEFPALTFEEIDRVSIIIASTPGLPDDSFDKKFEQLQLSGMFNLLVNVKLPYQPHAMQYLTQEQLKEKIEIARSRYENIDNACTEPTFLWQAEKPGCGKIFIFGTNHFMSPAFHIFTDALNALIEKSDVVMTEIEYLRSGNNSPNMSDYTCVDSYVANRAHTLGKELQALETEMIRRVAALDLTAKHKLDDDNVTLNSFLLEKIRSFFSSPDKEERKSLLQFLLGLDKSKNSRHVTERNMIWMEAILQASQVDKKNCFIAPGSGHVHGANSIPDLLHHEGYTLTPLMKVLPMTDKEMLRQTLSSPARFFAHQPTEPTIENSEKKELKRK